MKFFDAIKTYVIYVLLHRWNKISKESFDLIEEHWRPKKPLSKLQIKVLNKVKELNKNHE